MRAPNGNLFKALLLNAFSAATNPSWRRSGASLSTSFFSQKFALSAAAEHFVVTPQCAQRFASRYLGGVRQKLGRYLRSRVKQLDSDDATVGVEIEYDVRRDLGTLQNI